MSSSPISSSNTEAVAAQAEAAAASTLAPMLDVRCAVEVVLGTGTISVRDCLRLQRYSIVKLTQSAGSDLAGLVHGVTIAHREVVIVDETTALPISRGAPPPGVGAGRRGSRGPSCQA